MTYDRIREYDKFYLEPSTCIELPEIMKMENVLNGWRSNEEDMLILFMHSPPLNRALQTSEITECSFECVDTSTENYTIAESSEHTNIWKPPNEIDSAHGDASYAMPKRNQKKLIKSLSPKVFEYFDGSPDVLLPKVTRRGPVLTFAGHTHWKHTYSLNEVLINHDYKERGFIKFLQGNLLLNQLYNPISGVYENPNEFWENRSLIVTSGCVGPIPCDEMKLVDESFERLTNHDAGWTNPSTRQGFYIVEIELDPVKVDHPRVSRIEWKNMTDI